MAVSNSSWLEKRRTTEETLGSQDGGNFPAQIELDGLDHIVPDTPGLDVEISEDLAWQGDAEHMGPPHLQRPDGSAKNRWTRYLHAEQNGIERSQGVVFAPLCGARLTWL